MAGGQILAFPIDIDRRPYNILALPCECVMGKPHKTQILVMVSLLKPLMSDVGLL